MPEALTRGYYLKLLCCIVLKGVDTGHQRVDYHTRMYGNTCTHRGTNYSPSATRFYLLNQDYAFGHAVSDAFKKTFQKVKKSRSGNCWRGLTVYFALPEIGQPRAGDTIVVSAASGAVGSCAGQIAKIKGWRTVGITDGKLKAGLCVGKFG
jgi:hypothetical protein